jgi:ribosomal-protein-alanine N-acetyltransferase
MAAKKVTEVWLETATDNEAAIAFWQKHGYRKQGVRKGYYPDGRDAFTMRKLLLDAAENARNL